MVDVKVYCCFLEISELKSMVSILIDHYKGVMKNKHKNEIPMKK